jgi:hypothetical protein
MVLVTTACNADWPHHGGLRKFGITDGQNKFLVRGGAL